MVLKRGTWQQAPLSMVLKHKTASLQGLNRAFGSLSMVLKSLRVSVQGAEMLTTYSAIKITGYVECPLF